jgi:hypothetical protein
MRRLRCMMPSNTTLIIILLRFLRRLAIEFALRIDRHRIELNRIDNDCLVPSPKNAYRCRIRDSTLKVPVESMPEGSGDRNVISWRASW